MMYRHQGGGITPGMALTMVGQQLANALSQKWARKAHHDKMTSLYEAIAGKDPETPEDLPGYSESMDLAQSLVPPGPFGVAGSIANQQNVQQNAEKTLPQVQQSRRVLKEMMTSGDPRLEEMALAQIAPKKPLRGAERYMNLGGGMVLDLADESLLNFSGEKAEEMQVLKPGDIVRDPATGEVLYQAPKDSDMKEWSVEVGVGKGMKQRAVIRSDGSQTLYGKPYSEVKRIDQTNRDPIKDDPPHRRRLEMDKEIMENATWRLDDIEDRYQEAFLTWPGKAAAWAADKAAKVDVSGALKPLYEEYLNDFTGFERAVNENANLYIKDITGAQMSNAEAERLMKAIMNLKDNPVGFRSKLESMKAKQKVMYERKIKMIEDLLAEDPDLEYDVAKEHVEKVLESQKGRIEREIVDEWEKAGGKERKNTAGPKPNWPKPDGSEWVLNEAGTGWK